MSIKRYHAETIDYKHGEYVTYTDHATEVSALRVKLEIAQQLKVAIEDEANRTEASLRAQLEAAEKRLDQREQVLGMYIDKLHEAHKRINALSKPASCRFCGGDTHAQLTAQPEGKVRRLEDMTETELRILLGQVMQALAAPHSQGD